MLSKIMAGTPLWWSQAFSRMGSWAVVKVQKSLAFVSCTCIRGLHATPSDQHGPQGSMTGPGRGIELNCPLSSGQLI